MSCYPVDFQIIARHLSHQCGFEQSISAVMWVHSVWSIIFRCSRVLWQNPSHLITPASWCHLEVTLPDRHNSLKAEAIRHRRETSAIHSTYGSKAGNNLLHSMRNYCQASLPFWCWTMFAIGYCCCHFPSFMLLKIPMYPYHIYSFHSK